MEAIQAFLKEYDHIPPNEKYMALLLAEERFLNIKQAMEEEQNQPEVMQELLLKLMNDLQILKGSQQDKKEAAAQSFIPYWNFSMIDDEEARDNFLKDVCTFLRKFSRIPFGVMPKVLSIAWKRFGEIKDDLTDKKYQQEDIHESMNKLLEDVVEKENIKERAIHENINCPHKPKEITPDLPIEEPDNSLSMGDEHLDTILSVENLVPIPSELEGISEDTCDVPVYEDSSTFDALNDHSEILSDSNDDDTSSDDNDFEGIDRLITNIESLKDNPTPDRVLKSPSLVPISVTDSDSFFEESDTSFSFSDNSLPEFETFNSFLFEVEPDQGGLISIVIFDNSNDPLLELHEFESFHFDLYDDPSFLHTPPEPPDVEISLNIEPDVPEINNFDELNADECFDLGVNEIDVEDDDSLTFVIRTFLHLLTTLWILLFLYSLRE
ncbi:hypothetical protein Tco_1385840 [Tanacetum coccineum]